MAAINVKSEIKPLKKVLLHRPGKELENLTPDTLERLLFDDIPFLEVAQAEHDAFAQVLRENGVEVVYLEDLMAEVLDLSDEIRDKFIRQWIEEAGIKTRKWQDKIYDFMMQYKDDNKALVLKTMEGIVLNEVKVNKAESLVDLMSDNSKLLIDPMPNLYFTRDPFACIGNGVSLNRMYSVTRNRETIYGEYIFNYHPDYKGQVDKYFDRYNPFHIEGGDILNINDKVLAIGISQRTQADAIEMLAHKIFSDEKATINTILAFDIPESRAFMHLDTVFTQIDYDKFTIHPGILGPLVVYEITKGEDG
ncbi:MAG: arginine deiminase family protein, partial [Acetivibrio ethanolgignens]